MRCTKCGVENAASARFCNQCATPLSRACPKCAHLNAPDAKFCAECAEPLTSDVSKSTARTSSTSSVRIAPEQTDSDVAKGERKTVTALFADIKGSMDLIEDLDPEEARAIVDPALKLMMDAAHRYDGYIVQSTGDGIFALFGAPIAHEDHPQRALCSALRMQEEVKRYAEKLRAENGVNLQVRVGVNTGEVVVRSIKTDEAHTEYTPIGHSTSLASRLQALAAPGSIAVSETVRKLVEGYFALKPLGPARIKGVSEPVNVYEVTGLGPLRTRLQRAAARGYTKFVGRQREMDAMKDAAEQAKAGHGQIVAAIAEPGVGKSRLLFEFKAVSQAGWMVLEALSFPHGKASAFLPVIDLLWSYFKITSEDDQRTRREKINGKVLTLDRSLEDALPYLYALLGLTDENNPLAEIEPQTRKRRALEAIKRILLRESLNQPLIVIVEDLHWIDDGSQTFLNLLADSIGTARILLLVNYRPEYRHEWGHKTYYTQLRIDPLGKDSADEMLAHLLDEGVELGPLKRLIIKKTEGNPLFVEEMVQALFDDGALVRNGAVKLTRSLNQLKIPPTVQAILATRIDRLAPDHKDLLQTLAVIGTEFKLGLVSKVAAKSEPDLEPMLSELQLAEFIYEQPAVGDIEYTFKHALTHDVAYNSVLSERRRVLHTRIGAALEELYADNLDDHLAELAHHYARSDNPAKAVKYCLRAVRHCVSRGSLVEAVAHFETGLELLQKLPDDDQRAELELDLRNAVGTALSLVKGYASREAEQSFERAMVLCQRPGIDWEKSWWALVGICSVQLVRPNLRKAYEISAELVARAEEHGRVEHIWMALHMWACTRLYAGEFGIAAEGFDRGITLWESISKPAAGLTQQRAVPMPLALTLAMYGPVNRAHSALNLRVLGYPDRAVKRVNTATAMARELGLKAGLVEVHFLAAVHSAERGDLEHVREKAETAFELATEIGHPFALHVSEMLLGWQQAMAGEVDDGIARMRHHLSELRANGSELGHDLFLTLIATALGQSARFDEGLRTIDESFSCIERTGQRRYEAEVHRLKGELLLAQDASNAAQAQQCFRTAIEISRKQHAKSWELRATMSLARLHAKQGHRDEARTMLAEIYNWFTEGFDTADLKDAKSLLEELAG